MSDLDILIETTYRLSNTLSRMAEQERKYTYELCCEIAKISKEMIYHAETLNEIKMCVAGGY